MQYIAVDVRGALHTMKYISNIVIMNHYLINIKVKGLCAKGTTLSFPRTIARTVSTLVRLARTVSVSLVRRRATAAAFPAARRRCLPLGGAAAAL